MKTPSDEEIREAQIKADCLHTSRRAGDQETGAILRSTILWGLANLARAMRAEHDANRQRLENLGRYDRTANCEICQWTDVEWLNAAAESVGIKLEEK